jgi:hypothetical protein
MLVETKAWAPELRKVKWKDLRSREWKFAKRPNRWRYCEYLGILFRAAQNLKHQHQKISKNMKEQGEKDKIRLERKKDQIKTKLD